MAVDGAMHFSLTVEVLGHRDSWSKMGAGGRGSLCFYTATILLSSQNNLSRQQGSVNLFQKESNSCLGAICYKA